MTNKEKELVDYIFGSAENALAYLRINNIDDSRTLRIYVDNQYKYIDVGVTEFEDGKVKRTYGRKYDNGKSQYYERGAEGNENS